MPGRQAGDLPPEPDERAKEKKVKKIVTTSVRFGSG